MHVHARFTHPVQPVASGDRVEPSHLVVTIKGDDEATELRPKLTVIPVIDQSGSMGGPKLALAKAAIRFLAGELGDEDELALLSFGSDVHRHLPVTSADTAGRRRFDV